MKIVYLNSLGEVGGAEGVLLDLLAAVREAEPGWSLRVIVPAAGPLANRARALGVETEVVEFPPSVARLGEYAARGGAGRAALAARLLASSPQVARYVRRLRRALHRHAPDALHSNGLKMHALGSWAWGSSGAPAAVWHFHDYLGARPLMSRVLRASARSCAAAVANSRSVAADVSDALGGRVSVRTVYNAVNLEKFSPVGPPADLDALAGVPSAAQGTVRVGLVATLARWKGHETFLRALALVPRELNVRGYVVGGALYQTAGSQHSVEDLRQLAAQLGVAERVGFTGHVEDAGHVMRALDVVVHASTEPEPFGLVIAEAMACGRAVLTSAAGGAAEIVTPGVDALTHTPGDAEELARSIARLASDATLRDALGRAAHASARARFDRTRLAAEWIPIYRGLKTANGGLAEALHSRGGESSSFISPQAEARGPQPAID
ncbi:MAG TPA: glycosyltransferase family 4 protein [Pyrinomonadaceae bacterium]